MRSSRKRPVVEVPLNLERDIIRFGPKAMSRLEALQQPSVFSAALWTVARRSPTGRS